MEWAGRIARDVGERVQQARRRQRMSAQALADRCAELGLPMDRSVIAKLERGLRQGVSLAEVLVMARALEVPPLQLMLPIGHAVTAEVLPGVTVDTWQAAQWIEGSAPFPTDRGDDERGVTSPAGDWSHGAAAVRLWREHATAVALWRDRIWLADRLRQDAARNWKVADELRAQQHDPAASEADRALASQRISAVTTRASELLRQAESFEQLALYHEGKLRELRQQMRQADIALPLLKDEPFLGHVDTEPPASELERVLARRLADQDRKRHEGGAVGWREKDDEGGDLELELL
ncbi:hypothetical protein Ssi03_76970 [Sphaerisporangium siamense]|nr:hypothetical protein Ssi03_76970 [Sphaerisporangium siamense]